MLNYLYSTEVNRLRWRGESARGRKSQKANEPEGANGQKSHNSFFRRPI